MYIQPNTTIKLIKGVPLSNDYTDTLYWPDVGSQTAYFAGLPGLSFGAQTYQRVKNWVMRLQVPADQIYDYNYLMFQNTAHGSKWFYAFITKVEYINEAVSEITYELDVMQTWWGELVRLPSYVERETTIADIPGGNLAPEPVDLGPIICHSMERSGYMDSYSVIMARAEIKFPGTSGGSSSGSGSTSGGSGSTSGESGNTGGD